MTLNLVQLNCFLFPSMNYQDQARVEKILDFVKSYDIISLQEQWGFYIEDFQKNLQDTHYITDSNWSNSKLPSYLFEFWNTISYYYNSNGGLYFSSKKSLPIIKELRYKYQNSNTQSRKGIQMVLLDISSLKLKLKNLVIINTHLDPFNIDQMQEKQLKELEDFINSEFGNLIQGLDPSEISCILLGDFNLIEDSFTHFTKKLNTLSKKRDLYQEYCNSMNKKPKKTFYERDENLKVLSEGWSGRIDYNFGLDEINNIKLKPIKVKEVNIIEDLEFSDHLPIEIKLEIE